MEKTSLFAHPRLWCTIYPGRVKVRLYTSCIAQRNKGSEMEHWVGDHFSDRYFAMRPPRNWRQKYLRANQYSIWIVKQRSICRTFQQIICHSYRVIGDIPKESKLGATSSHVIESCFTWNLSDAVRFVCKWETWGFLLPKELVTDKMGLTEKNCQYGPGRNPPPTVLRLRCTEKYLHLFQWILRKIWSNWLHVKFQGYWVPVAQTRTLYRDGY